MIRRRVVCLAVIPFVLTAVGIVGCKSGGFTAGFAPGSSAPRPQDDGGPDVSVKATSPSPNPTPPPEAITILHPPLPSPPRMAPCSMIASEMKGWPTGVRITVPPYCVARRSIRLPVETLVTIDPWFASQRILAAIGKVNSSDSGWPNSVTIPRRSPSAS